MTKLAFRQVDVFTDQLFRGNPLAVVIGADALDDATMARFANWTNLSETTFLLEPTDPAADYRVRIFTPEEELPFAGHPTLGSAHVWRAAGGVPKATEIVQECDVGLVRIRSDGARLAFAAPPLIRDGGVDEEMLEFIARGLGIGRRAIVAAQWVSNGPPWVAVMLASRDELLTLRPDYPALGDLFLGVVAPWTGDGAEAQYEVRAFVPASGVPEDPVTGSLNAGIAQWLIGSGRAADRYVASQGTVLGRAGRVHVERIGADIWIGGTTMDRIVGDVSF